MQGTLLNNKMYFQVNIYVFLHIQWPGDRKVPDSVKWLFYNSINFHFYGETTVPGGQTPSYRSLTINMFSFFLNLEKL